MNRDEFMRQVDYLLSDIPEEEKKDALAYYRDYLEEAGDQEQEALREFGSPERIAAIIRSDIRGDLEDGGEFTDAGYTDRRFREPNYQIAARPAGRTDGESAGGSGRGSSGSGGGSSGEPGGSGPGRQPSGGQIVSAENGTDKKGMTFIKAVVIIAVVVVLFPVILGVGGSALGGAAAVLCILAGFVLLVAAVTLILLLLAFGIGIYGITQLFSDVFAGVLCIGIGLVLLSFGLLALLLAVLFYGKFLPWLFRNCVELVSRLFHRR